jgi:Collagen triple helix repeat (20 copies)
MRTQMIAVAAFVLFSATTVWAGDQVRACVNVKTGTIRLLVAGTKCPTGQVLVVSNPNGTGPQGPPGVAGPQGPLGPQGPAGPQGSAGVRGANGLQGSAGVQGPAGVPGPAGAQGSAGVPGPAGAQGSAGVQGPAGAQGLQGLPGPPAAAAEEYLGSIVVDQDGQDVGVATDPFGGLVVRHVGEDAVVFFVSPAGPVTGAIDFYHATVDCSDNRYLPIAGGAGFAHFAYVHGGSVFYTKTMDPSMSVQVSIQAYEHFEQNEDAALPGTCTAMEGGAASLGVVTAVSDPVLANLRLPLRLK